jgi:uncharacterized protein
MKKYSSLLILPLLLLNANAQEKTNKADAEVLKRGQEVYNRTCIACHQPSGKGIPPAFPPLDGSDWLSKDPTISIKIILKGLQGPIKVNGTDFNGMMPAVVPALSDQEIADVLTFVNLSWSNDHPAVTAEEVKKVRDSIADRTTPYTAAELGK